jgi:hypothetical protein
MVLLGEEAVVVQQVFLVAQAVQLITTWRMLPALVILGLSRRVAGHLEELVLLVQMAVLILAVVVGPERLVLLLLGLTVVLVEPEQVAVAVAGQA